MSELAPLRDAVDALAERAVPPDFGDLSRRAVRRRRRRIGGIVAASVMALAGSALAATALDDVRRSAPSPADPLPAVATNGWVAIDVFTEGGGDIYLARPGSEPEKLEVLDWQEPDDACPAWTPDGSQLLFGRLLPATEKGLRVAQLVIVAVGPVGGVGEPKVITLDEFEGEGDLRVHPCATWAPDGRWVAFRSKDGVWVVDTFTTEVRRLEGLMASDLEWRPGTDELTIAGSIDPGDGGTSSSSVTTYSVSSGETRQLGSVSAGEITWSPDGTTLAYTGGEDGPDRLWLVDADGTDERVLVDAMATSAFGGAGPVWSPDGSRIAYQRSVLDVRQSNEHAKIGLVDVADGSLQVIEPPDPPVTGLGEHTEWWPRWSTWSPDGTALLYSAWCNLGPLGRDGEAQATIVVPVDAPDQAAILTDLTGVAGDVSRAALQVWGRR